MLESISNIILNNLDIYLYLHVLLNVITVYFTFDNRYNKLLEELNKNQLSSFKHEYILHFIKLVITDTIMSFGCSILVMIIIPLFVQVMIKIVTTMFIISGLTLPIILTKNSLEKNKDYILSTTKEDNKREEESEGRYQSAIRDPGSLWVSVGPFKDNTEDNKEEVTPSNIEVTNDSVKEKIN